MGEDCTMKNDVKTPEMKSPFSFRKAIGGFNIEDVIDYISDENKRFKEEREFLGDKIDEAELRAKDAEETLEAAKAEHEAEVAELKRELQSAVESEAAANEALAEKDALINELRAELENVRSELGVLKTEFEAKDAECEGLYSKRLELEGEIADAKSKMSALSAELFALGKERDILKDDIAKIKASAVEEHSAMPSESPSGARESDSLTGKHTPVQARESARRQSDKEAVGKTDAAGKSSGAVPQKMTRSVEAITDSIKVLLDAINDKFKKLDRIANENKKR